MLTHVVDRHLLRHHVARVVAQSKTIQARLSADFNIAADVVYPPAPPRRYRCDGYGDYIFAVSRLMPMKRLDLLIRAMADPAAGRVRAVIAGEGESEGGLRRLASESGGFGARRVHRPRGRTGARRATWQLPGRVLRAAGRGLWIRYGGSVRVAESRRDVPRQRGPAEIVADGVPGVVCEPTPAAVAVAVGRLADDRALAEKMGAAAFERGASLKWADVVSRLLR